MATEKNYIGNGRQKAGSEYITLSICLEDLMASEPVERNGKHYLRAVVAKRRSSDTYGRTHTVYVPAQLDETEKMELQRNRVADQQEIEFRNCEA
jgi:hypothetical protein